MVLAIDDERGVGTPIDVVFTGTLRTDKDAALRAALSHETGVLVAPPGFGKTVTVIAARATSALVLVHRMDMLRQWRDRLTACLGLDPKAVGVLSGD